MNELTNDKTLSNAIHLSNSPHPNPNPPLQPLLTNDLSNHLKPPLQLNLSAEDNCNDFETKKTQPHTDHGSIEATDVPMRRYVDILDELRAAPRLHKVIKEAIIELSFETVNYDIKEELLTIESTVVNSKKMLMDYLNSYFNEYLMEEYIIIDAIDEENSHSTVEDKHFFKVAQVLNAEERSKEQVAVKNDNGVEVLFTRNDLQNIFENVSNRYWKIENISGGVIHLPKSELEKARNCLRRQAFQDYIGMTHYVNLYNFIAKSMVLAHPNEYSRKDARVKSFKANVKLLQADYNQLLQVLIVNDINGKLHLMDLSTASKKLKIRSKLNESYIDLHGSSFNPCPAFKSPSYCKNELNHAIQLLDENNDFFYVLKCFIKHLANKLIHNEALPKRDKVIDIYGTVRLYSPSTLRDILIQITNIAECYTLKENKYVVLREIDPLKKETFIKREYLLNQFKEKNNVDIIQPFTERISSGVIVTTQSGEIRRVYKSDLSLEYCFMKVFDMKGEAYVVSFPSFKKLFEKLVNNEHLEANEMLDLYSGEKMALKPGCIRAKVANYFSLKPVKAHNPYRILNEDKKSFFKVTNLLNGRSLMMRTRALLNILKADSTKDFVFIGEDSSVRLCIEEVKQTLKEENRENEYLHAYNINSQPCFIKKEVITESIELLIHNRPFIDVINAIDNDDQLQFINLAQVLPDIIELSPMPYVKDEVLHQKSNTYAMSPHKVIALISEEQWANRTAISELFELIRVSDTNKEHLYVRKPFIRNMLMSGESIPGLIEIDDMTFNDKRTVRRQDLLLIESSGRPKESKATLITVIYRINTYVEILDSLDKKHLVLKDSLLPVIKGNSLSVEDIQGNRFSVKGRESVSQIKLSHEWIKISNSNKKDIVVYKSIITKMLIDHHHNIPLKKEMEVIDYDGKMSLIAPYLVLDSFSLHKRTDNTKVIIEVFVK